MTDNSPQIENGHTDIANEIVDKFCRYRISGEEWMVLWVVLRKTYGWHKKEDFITLTQFSELSGLSRSSVVRAIKRLVTKKILCSYKNDTTTPVKYRFNKHYNEWQVVTKKQPVSKGSYKNVNKVVTKKQPSKETIQKKIIPPIIPPYLRVDLWNDYLDMRKKIKKVATEKGKELILKKLERFKKQGEDPNAVLEQSIEHSWQGVFPVKDKPVSIIKHNEDTEYICHICKQKKRNDGQKLYDGNNRICPQCEKKALEEKDAEYRRKWWSKPAAEREKDINLYKQMKMTVPEWMLAEGK